jgi:hypothetical protein
MKLRRHIIKNMLIATACISLTGCETVEQNVANLQNKLNNFKMPSFVTRTEQPATGQEVTEAPVEKAVPASEIILSKSENCPDVSVVEELGTLHQFSRTDSTRGSDRMSAIQISDVVSGCRYTDNNIVVEMNMRFEGQIGPKGRVLSSDEPRFSYPFFVAIASPEGEIMAKDIFGASVFYEAGQNTTIHTENIRQIIPMEGQELGSRYSVLIGFQLTETQLAYNRANGTEVAGNGILFAPSYTEPAAGDVRSYEETPYDNYSYDEAPSKAPVSITAPAE